MIGTRRIRVTYLLGSLLALTASLHAATAYASPGDPPSGSPAGAVYKLPLESGRSDAAPGGGGSVAGAAAGAAAGAGAAAAGAGAADGSEEDSLYRSENNFGSSSHVPGVAAAGDTGSAATGPGGDPGPSGAPTSGTIAAGAADTGNTSVGAGAILLVAIALLAAAAGILSRRFSGRPGE